VERTRDELARSNADLEQFAYVASHDLSEPLRKVANFCQLLERQYANELDDRAKQYIGFAVDGAKRMQALIGDLLALSRVGRTTDAFVPVDTGAALDDALANLERQIAESGAGIGRSDMPTVLGDRALLAALFENLVGNAIKYRGVDPPLVVITAVRNPAAAGWEFAVKDNGIGIDPQYRERVFAIFQRLHLRDKYGGTGIGLALCRKIVEFHGGRIWLDTSDGPGATFRFTIPDRATLSRRDRPAGEASERRT
jgi:light-regulated signal transduction histidine kinase (bacteriophytochrome)